MEPTRSRGRRRVDGVELPRHRADATTESTPEILFPHRTDHPNYVAASRAVTKVFGKPPDLTREGGSIPVANWLADATGMNVLLLPTSASNDGAHAQNEKWDKVNVTNAVKVLGTYLHEISKLVGPRPALCKCAPPTAEDLAKPGFFAFAKGFRCKCEL